MNKIKVYIASPYSKGDTGENVRAQLDAFDQLIDLGFIPFAPLWAHFQQLKYPRTYTEWIAWDLEWLPMCDCLLRLPGESHGANIEIEKARDFEMPVFYSIKELVAFFEK